MRNAVDFSCKGGERRQVQGRVFRQVFTFVRFEKVFVAHLFVADLADDAIGHLGAEVGVGNDAVGVLRRLTGDDFVRQLTGGVEKGLEEAEIARG